MTIIDSLFPDGVATPTLIPADTLACVLTPRLAIDAIATYLRGGDSVASERMVTPVAAGDMLLMPAESSEWVGVKLASVAPANPSRALPRIQGTYHLFDAATLTPRAVFDATMLTALRTPAVSAVAADLLAPPGPAHLVVFGTSVQAEAHVACLAEVRDLASVTLVGRDPGRAAALAARLEHPASWLAADDAGPHLRAALEAASIVATCTSASHPVVDGRWLAPDALVIAIGSHSPDARELDGETLRNAYLVVENREAAWREYGDLILARAEGAIGGGAVTCDLRELARNEAPPKPPGRRAVFKSAGMGWEDLAVASAAWTALSDADPSMVGCQGGCG
ncbi:MAG: ornithine cyclodeaminase family protein [Bifidobacteriaceae bacterium]|jgi:ornithine cyclodeaminase|nr:ornithine cyclodeaminase family protein [Bifidobacteriaceae bacterium]